MVDSILLETEILLEPKKRSSRKEKIEKRENRKKGSRLAANVERQGCDPFFCIYFLGALYGRCQCSSHRAP